MGLFDSFKKTKIIRTYNENEIVNLYKNKECLYVRANGNNDNDGLSEQTPFENLEWAFNIAQKYKIYKIIVIGKLDYNVLNSPDSVFSLAINPDFNEEILITGKTEAKIEEKALLTSNNNSICVLHCFFLNNTTKGKIRFENIEILNGDFGLWKE